MTIESTGNETVDAQFGEQSTENDIEAALVEKETEQAKQPEDEQTTESVEFNKKFAALSRKEKDLRSRESMYEQKMQELQERLAEIESRSNPVEEVKEELPLEYRLKKDPLGTLKDLGFDYETLTELALNDGKLPNEMKLNLMREELEKDYKTKFEELESRLNEKEKNEEAAKYNKVIEDFKMEIDNFVDKDPEEYELIKANNATDLVYDIIEEHYNETGRVLAIEEASKAVEEYLEEEAKKLFSLKKFSKVKENTNEIVEPETRRQPSPTLSNDHSAASQNQADRKLSNEESVYNVAKLLKWDD